RCRSQGATRVKTLHSVVYSQPGGEKRSAPKRGFFPALSSRLTFPLVARMPWRGLCFSSTDKLLGFLRRLQRTVHNFFAQALLASCCWASPLALTFLQ